MVQYLQMQLYENSLPLLYFQHLEGDYAENQNRGFFPEIPQTFQEVTFLQLI